MKFFMETTAYTMHPHLLLHVLAVQFSWQAVWALSLSAIRLFGNSLQ